MRIIKKLTELIEEELVDAEKYATLALNGQVVKLIALHENDPDPRTESMKLAHEILHERAIEKEKSVRILQSMFRE